MNLDLVNNLINSTKENKVIQSFIKELGKILENNPSNQVSLVQKVLHGRTLTTKFRDEINIQRHEIINKYSEENPEQGEFYYVYNKRADNTYGIVSHENGEAVKNIGIKESELPEGAGIDSVLIMKNGKFVLNKDATQKLRVELTNIINRLLEEQTKWLQGQRIEGHLYEFVEKTGDTVWLVDETNSTGECFEEIDFPVELLDKATQGAMFQYMNGEYQLKQ